MTKLVWNEAGNRFFEAGVDRGVFYPMSGDGVAWNGLVSVDETPSGGEPVAYYIDGIKYLNASSPSEFSGTIEAYTYPEEFAKCDGTASFDGLEVYQQERSEFNFSYRTLIGNDLDGVSYGYKIHLVYNALATPSQNTRDSISSDVEALTFAWDFTTRVDTKIPASPATPLNSLLDSNRSNKSSLIPFSHVSIDSTKTTIARLRYLENILYGSSSTEPRLPRLTELFTIFEGSYEALMIDSEPVTGLSPLIANFSGKGDLLGSVTEGIYYSPEESRLNETAQPGIYTLE